MIWLWMACISASFNMSMPLKHSYLGVEEDQPPSSPESGIAIGPSNFESRVTIPTTTRPLASTSRSRFIFFSVLWYPMFTFA